MFFCGISGEPPQDPVVSSKSGHVYERRLILKYITDNGTDPVTGEKLSESDLVSVKSSPDQAPPRPPTRTSIPTLLHTLQNEWDALVLETFTLKTQYNSVRQQLSHALYSQDAATRVIARLIKERDAAREALSNVQSTIGIAPTPAAPDVEMEAAEPAEAGMPKVLVEQINDLHGQLYSVRRKRKALPDHGTVEDVKKFVSKHTIPSLHSPSPSGINSIALSKDTPGLFLTGGNDSVVQLYDRKEDKILATLKGHSKKIHQVAFREKAGEAVMLLSASADKTARVWVKDAASGEYAPRHTVKAHKGEVTGLFVHPLGTIAGLTSLDKTFSIQDLTSFTTVYQSLPSEEGYTCTAVHPDGALFAVGTHTSTVHIYDIRTGELAATLNRPDSTPFTVNTLSFSENGYHLCAPTASHEIGIWDLRKQSIGHTIDLGDDFKVNKVSYDVGAQYFGVAGSGGGRIYQHKSWQELIRFEEGGEMSDLIFGADGRELWGVTGREVRIWGLP